MRYFIDLAYDGSNYHGWQVQQNAQAIQPLIEKALSIILKETVQLTGSGRTDTGVHASQQVAHFDYSHPVNTEDLSYKVNAILPFDLAVRRIYPVKEEAHARFSAILRKYEYRIIFHKDPFRFKHALQIYWQPDFQKMKEASAFLTSFSNFRSFSTAKTDPRDFNCIIHEAVWRWDLDSAVFTISANRFLRGMVRALVGTLLEVGKGTINLEEFRNIIVQQNRQAAGITAPAHGLSLVAVNYPDDIYA